MRAMPREYSRHLFLDPCIHAAARYMRYHAQCKVWNTHKLAVAEFLVTQTSPPLRYLPATLVTSLQRVVDIQRAEAEAGLRRPEALQARDAKAKEAGKVK